MRLQAWLLVAALPAHGAPAGEVHVRARDGLVDVEARAATLQEVLGRLSQQTGMKVVYDGAPPRALVTVSLPGRTPLEAVLALFEGLGVNYAIRADRSGTLVDTLIVSTLAVDGSLARSAPPAPAVPANPLLPPLRSAPPREARPSEEDAEDEAPAEEDDKPPAEAAASPQPPPTFAAPLVPGQPGSPFGTGPVGPLTLPTPPPPQPQPVPGVPVPLPTPTPGAPR